MLSQPTQVGLPGPVRLLGTQTVDRRRADRGFGPLPAELLRGAVFSAGLWRLLRRPPSLEQARLVVRQRLDSRERDFLDLLQRAVYRRPGSPYWRLLRAIGCEQADIARLVHREGVEGALATLWRSGVYLSVEELKGRRPVVRGSTSFWTSAHQLRNPWLVVRSPYWSGRRVPIYEVSLADHAIGSALIGEARQAADWSFGLWGGLNDNALCLLARYFAFGGTPARWFSHVEPRGPRTTLRDRWCPPLLRAGGRLGGRSMPRPEYASTDAPDALLDWMVGETRAGRVVHLHTTPTQATRLHERALERGVEPRRVRYTLGGEPLTRSRLEPIRASEAEALASYGTREAGVLAEACLQPAAPDDLHLADDLHAFISAGSAEGSLPASALLVTTLRESWPLFLLNASLGDQATLTDRACGCVLEAVGRRRHARDVRSFEKLNLAGESMLDLDLVALLEETLPRSFGGRPTDYQVLVDEDEVQPRLRLRVHPQVAVPDLSAVGERFLATVQRSDPEVATQWRRPGLLRVERGVPLRATTGKQHHVHRLNEPERAAGQL